MYFQPENPGKEQSTLCSQHFLECVIARNKTNLNYYLEILNWLEITAGSRGSSGPCESFMKLYLTEFFLSLQITESYFITFRMFLWVSFYL